MSALVNSILTRYQADPGPHKAAIRQLRGEEKKRHEAMLKEIEAQNRKIDDQIKFWGKVTVVAGGAVLAYKAASKSLDSYIANTNLASATAGLNMNKLTAATRGLVEQTDLMRVAAELQTGAWKLNEREIETVLRSADALSRRVGGELEPTLQKLTESLKKGTTEELKQLGIQAKDKTAVMRELGLVIDEVGVSGDRTGDGLKRAGVKMRDTLDNLATATGRVVIQLEPMIEKLAEGTQKLLEYGDELSDRLAGVSKATNTGSASRQLQLQLQALEYMAANPDVLRHVRDGDLSNISGRAAQRRAGQGLSHLRGMGFERDVLQDLAQGDINQNIAALRAQMNRGIIEEAAKSFEAINVAIVRAGTSEQFGAAAMWLEEAKRTAKKVKDKARAARPDLDGEIDGLLGFLFGTGQAFTSTGRAFASAAMSVHRDPRTEAEKLHDYGAGMLGYQGLDGGAMVTEAQKYTAELKVLVAEADAASKIAYANQAAFAGADRDKFLTGIFGPLSEFNAYASAFGILERAVGSAFDAWITGQASVGKALKMAVAEGLRATAVDASIQALKNTAYGFAALASGPIGGISAGGYFTAAAQFGAVAAAAGLGARAMGAGQGGGARASMGGSAPRVYNGSGSSSGNSGGPRQTVIMLGRDFQMLSDLEQRQLMAQAINRSKDASPTSPHGYDR